MLVIRKNLVDFQNPSMAKRSEINPSKSLHIKVAESSDTENIFKLSNESEVRRNSIDKESISWESHREWFNNKITDTNYKYYVIYSKTGDFIGQVRFDIKGENAIINISICSEFRGLGLSSSIVNETSRLIFLERDEVKVLYAYIKPSNIASVKCFLKCGYLYVEDTQLDSVKFEVYIFNRTNHAKRVF